jgi:hypothetical protein
VKKKSRPVVSECGWEVCLNTEREYLMCRYAKQGQSRPRRCFYLEDPCDECAAEEQIKMDELYEEHVQSKQVAEPVLVRINDHLVCESF